MEIIMNDYIDRYGTIQVKIKDVMIEKGLSRTRLAQLACLQRKQLNKLLDGTAVRVDFAVLARICSALECDISDILEYKSNNIVEKKV